MAEAIAPRIQFRDEIKPMKSNVATAYNATVQNPSLSGNIDSYDLEIAQKNIADEDLNRTKKQVSPTF